MPHRFARPVPWVWDQHWRDVLFLHWQVPVAALRPLVPERLDIDMYDGHLSEGVRARFGAFVPQCIKPEGGSSSPRA
jgi:hypothetical protein